MPLTGMCIELRPNLSSGVVFLHFDRSFSNRAKTRLVIKEHDVHITEVTNSIADPDSELIIRYGSFGMDIRNVSTFMVTGNHISFRFNYTHIDLDALDASSVSIPLRPLRLQFEEHTSIVVHCGGCEAELVSPRTYSRLREFPSCVIDPSEFFCHNHHNACASNTNTNSSSCSSSSSSAATTPSLVPGATDLFYGLNHIVLNISTLQRRIEMRGEHLYCARCMRLLGLTIINGAAAKLWADTIRWRPFDDDHHLRSHRHLFEHRTLTQLMLRLLQDLWPPQLSPIMNKALLVATLPNRHQQYMLIHVLEPQLRVLRPNKDTSELSGYRACKLYFRVYHGRHEPPLLQQWQQQHDVPKASVSLSMFEALNTELTTNAMLIPLAWRHNTAEEQLLLSYFFYEETPVSTAAEPLQSPLPQAQPPLPVSVSSVSVSPMPQSDNDDYDTDLGQDDSQDDDDDDDDDVDDDDGGDDGDSDDDKQSVNSGSGGSELKTTTPPPMTVVAATTDNPVAQHWPNQPTTTNITTSTIGTSSTTTASTTTNTATNTTTTITTTTTTTTTTDITTTSD